jgi:hypothetical protein
MKVMRVGSARERIVHQQKLGKQGIQFHNFDTKVTGHKHKAVEGVNDASLKGWKVIARKQRQCLPY